MRAALLALAVLLAPATASAQVVSYVFAGEPTFSLEYPPGWEIRTPLDPDKPLLSAVPRDGSLLWHGVWIVNASSRDEAEERLRALEGRLFEAVEFPSEPWTESHGGLEVRCLSGSGTYKGDRPMSLFLGLFELPEQRTGAFVYMGEPEAVSRHQEDLRAMLASLRSSG